MSNRVCAAVVLNQYTNQQYDYYIRYNHSDPTGDLPKFLYPFPVEPILK